jgi:2-C-methyl-D-erythritol 4-phosphate cytidylyltransferase/2-C-methyl-D-erythritol 2,4-cyclodiphosphate synthase
MQDVSSMKLGKFEQGDSFSAMIKKPNQTVALIVAAGRGRRFGGAQPKQYAPLGSKTVLRRTVEAFSGHPDIHAVRVMIHPDDMDLYKAALDGLADGLYILEPVFGGATRQESVRLGLESLESLDDVRKVLIHDAARPFVSALIIDEVVKALDTHSGALPALAVADTLKRADSGQVQGTVSREGLWRAQTPQGFHFTDILEAHRRFKGEELTDDVQLFERAGYPVILTPGTHDNFKITTEEDLMRAERLLSDTTETRTGTGLDAHRFEAGDHVTLCGVNIPFSQGLKGHSDADVALHALTDALLGAVGQGDIGQHFPPSDPQWKGASSDRFATHAAKLVRQEGGTIVNVDITIVCEQPRISAHKDAMRARVAEILDIDTSRVSVKGTTTEEMGFTGRKEGILAQATANVRLTARR